MRRTVLIADRLFYRVRVRSFRPGPVATMVEVSLAADFADVFEVRGVERRTSGRLLPPTRDGDRLRFRYVAADGQRRETLVELEPSPARVRIDGGRVHVAWDVRARVRPGVLAADHGASCSRRSEARGADVRAGAARLDAAHAAWVGACAAISTDNELFDRLIDASRARPARADDAGRRRSAAGRGDSLVRGAVRARLAAERVRDADDQPGGGARNAVGARRATGP